MVCNPPEDATDPDEWFDFFSRFGRVKYVTVNLDNAKLLKLLLQKRLIMREYSTYRKPYLATEAVSVATVEGTIIQRLEWFFGIGTSSDEYKLRTLFKINQDIDLLCKTKFKCCAVYITFETETEKMHCLELLNIEKSVVNYIRGVITPERRFRNFVLIDADESSEPDNISWLNAGISENERYARSASSFLFTAAVLYACFLLVSSQTNNAGALVAVISVLNSILPVIFICITDIEGTIDEDDRQNSFMIKLYCARVLTAVIFPFMGTTWNTFPDVKTIASIKNVQLSSCFLSPFLQLLDINGIISRQILTRLFARNQADANRYWSGTKFTLAERYTEISKTLFISLFYSFLDPTSLFIGALACINTFFIDRYLLLRRTSQPPMLDNSMGPTVSDDKKKINESLSFPRRILFFKQYVYQ